MRGGLKLMYEKALTVLLREVVMSDVCALGNKTFMNLETDITS